MPRLERLDLSHNALEKVTLPHGSPYLTTLDVTGNALEQLSAPAYLRVGIDAGSMAIDGFPAGEITFFEIAHIPDPALLAAVRHALGKPAGDVTLEDMGNLIALEAKGVTSIEGLQAATNLQALNLSGTRTGTGGCPYVPAVPDDLDLSPLRGLSALARLDLHGNALRNIELPDGLSGLTFLDLSCNELQLLTLPADLASLTTLAAINNDLVSVNIPEGVDALEMIYLSGNRLTGLALPAGLGGLTTLSLNGNDLPRLHLPAGLTNLHTLHLSDNPLVETLTIPGDASQLTDVSVDGSQLPELELPESLRSAYEGGQLRIAGLTAGAVQYYDASRLRISSFNLLPDGIVELTVAGPLGPLVLETAVELGNWSERLRFQKTAGEEQVRIAGEYETRYFRFRRAE
jgi:Leucine-rich repeat (LRR) protein